MSTGYFGNIIAISQKCGHYLAEIVPSDRGDTMQGMAKRKKPDLQQQEHNEAKEGFPFRFVDRRLREVVQAFADHDRRSLNLAMTILLEEALKARGLWPPPSQPSAPEVGDPK